VRQPQSLKTAVGIMWIGAAVQALGALSTVLFVSQIREEAEEQLLADGQVASESTLDAAVTVGVVFAIFFGLLYAGLWAWMAVKNGAGRSWARIVASVFAGLGILFNLLGLVGASFNGASGTTTPGLVQNVITLGLAIGATVMMWRSENALYYQANS
jgi:hypothetical protein